MMLSLAFLCGSLPAQAAAVPTITSISPSQTTAGTFTLTITGSSFDSGAVDQIYWKADDHFVGRGTVQSRTSSKIVVTESMTGATPGAYVVKVKNSNGQISNGMTLTIKSSTPSAPTITSISPTQTTAGTFTLTITGSNFDSGAVDQIYWKADDHFVGRGTVQSRTSSKIVVTESMAGATPGAYVVKVKNSNGQISNGVTLTINTAANSNPIQVLFKAQCPPGTWAATKNCGQTSSLMVFCYYAGTTPTEQGIKNIDNWLYQKYGSSQAVNGYNGAYTTTTILETLAKQYGGYPNSYKATGWTINRIKQEINAGHPVIVAVTAKYLPNRGYSWAGGHFVVVKGYTATHLIVNDPGTSSGNSKAYLNSDFQTAMGSGSVVVVIPNQ